LFFLQEIRLEFGLYNTTTEPWQLLNGTENVPTLGVTALRKSDDYIRGYLMWTRLFTTAIIPVTLLLILNVLIIRDVITSAKKVNRYVYCLPMLTGPSEGLKIWGASIDAGGIICTLVEIGLTDLPKSGGARHDRPG
jgi:ABC-type sugar transport system permease subunit